MTNNRGSGKQFPDCLNIQLSIDSHEPKNFYIFNNDCCVKCQSTKFSITRLYLY